MVVRERSESQTISISFFIFTRLKIPSSHFHTKQIFCLYRSKEYQACLSLYRATADHIFFTDYNFFTSFPKFVVIEETKLRFESVDKFNSQKKVKWFIGHFRAVQPWENLLWTKTCPSISEPQMIITHYEAPPSFPHPVMYNLFPVPPPHPPERGLEILVREGQHLSFGS